MHDLGIIICTYNRCPALTICLDGIIAKTQSSFEIVVADDGSADNTVEMVRSRGIPCITGRNRGIAWNKNRGLFHFTQIKPCRTIILIEDDCCPSDPVWERDWVDGAQRWGHVNHAGAGLTPYHTGGTGTAEDPYTSTMISGQCSSFSHEALNYVGYLDTRFGQYGHEHVEHTKRFLRAGYGGILATPEMGKTQFYLVNGNISASFAESFGSESAVAQNGQIFEQIKDEPIHRWAWRTDEELAVFRTEMETATL